MTLASKPFGTTGMEITRVGFGAWAIGGGDWSFAWGPQEDAQSVAAIRYAIEQGVNWIDTAAVYGLGHSEEVVGQALKEIPDGDRPYVFTKCGLIWDPSDRSVRPERSGAEIRREVEDSLRRLGVERIDLYQMHWPAEDGTPLEEYWQALLDLKAEGKIRAAGLSNHDVSRLQTAGKIGHVDSLQPPFSAIHRSAATEIGWSAEHGTGVIVYSPMQAGLLTGAFSRARVDGLPDDDWRKGHPDFTTKLDANLALADALVPIARRHEVQPAAIAVAWALAWDGVTGAIVGARRPDQIDGWLAAADLRLTTEDLEEVAAAIDKTGAGDGPVSP